MTTRMRAVKTTRRKASPLSGKVQTVLGPIEPGKLGITHTHEQLLDRVLNTKDIRILTSPLLMQGYISKGAKPSRLDSYLTVW